MHVTSDLRLALPVRVEEREKPNPEKLEDPDVVCTLWAYHTPITTDMIEANYRLIVNAKHLMFSKGIRFAFESAAHFATQYLRDAAKIDTAEFGSEDSSVAFLGELKRLTLILANGVDPLPVDQALKDGVLDPEEWKEVEAAIVFFTLAYATARRNGRTSTATTMAETSGGSITSLAPMEFLASLQMSTPAVTSAAPAIPERSIAY